MHTELGKDLFVPPILLHGKETPLSVLNPHAKIVADIFCSVLRIRRITIWLFPSEHPFLA